MISGQAARSESLRPVTQIQVQGISPGTSWHRAYLFHLAFESSAAPANASGNVTLNVLSNVLMGAELRDGLDFDLIIGMDVIALGRLVVDPDGSFSFAY